MLTQAKTVYIFHKNGSDSHYIALDYLLKEYGDNLKYREFSVISNFFKSIFSLNFTLLWKQFVNLGFIINLLFSSKKKIVLGIAPYDSKLIPLLFILKNHQVYYHTSWTCWDKSFHPKQKRNTLKVYETWRLFLEVKCKHIFAVTQQSKNQLIENYKIDPKNISVVYHALDNIYSTQFKTVKDPLSFIYFGRLVPQKGLEELLYFFSKQKKASITIVGDGKEKELVNSFADRFDNIKYIPHTANKEALAHLLSSFQYLVLNSKRTNKWEELFGLAIIESMAQGLIPIATNHSGPKEIITNEIGFLCNEGDITSLLEKIIKDNYFDESMSGNAKQKSNQYLVKPIAQRWQAILN